MCAGSTRTKCNSEGNCVGGSPGEVCDLSVSGSCYTCVLAYFDPVDLETSYGLAGLLENGEVHGAVVRAKDGIVGYAGDAWKEVLFEGDEILSVNGTPWAEYDTANFYQVSACTAVVMRNGQQQILQLGT
jgi:hypothetical protein